MKIALIADTHFGVKGDNPDMLRHQIEFFDNVFFPYLRENKIDTVFHLGDTFDNRRRVNVNTANEVKKMFSRNGLDNDTYTWISIIGNHDAYYKTTNDVNSVSEILTQEEFPDFTYFINSPGQHLLSDGTFVGFVPWINQENEKECLDFIEKTNSKYLFGHFEIQGSQMYRGLYSKHGLNKKIFSAFDGVYSGHFHHRNGYYIGSPYQMTWADHGDERGFGVLDTKTGELEFINNPKEMFKIINFPCDEEIPDIEGTFVKVFIDGEQDFKDTDKEKFLEKIHKMNPADVKIDERKGTSILLSEQADNMEIEDILDTMSHYIPNNQKLLNLMRELYIEASDHD